MLRCELAAALNSDAYSSVNSDLWDVSAMNQALGQLEEAVKVCPDEETIKKNRDTVLNMILSMRAWRR